MTLDNLKSFVQKKKKKDNLKSRNSNVLNFYHLVILFWTKNMYEEMIAK